MNKYILTLFLISVSFVSYAQRYEISGTIVDEKAQPIGLVNVYVSGSTIGTATDSEGRFKLNNIKPGQYDLILSHINYEVYYLPIQIGQNSIDIGEIKLKEIAYELTTVEVKQQKDKKWNKHFKQFKSFLLGEFYKNKYIKIPDSYNADFEVEGKTIKESYPFQLNIINTYTGFEIYYAVETFRIGKKGPQYILGYPRFTELQANDTEQQDSWEQNRFDAYRGSLRHFFKALLENTLEENGFKAQLTNTIIADKDEAVSETNRYTIMDRDPKFKELLTIESTPTKGVLRIKFDNYLRIQYENEMGKDQMGQFSMVHSPEGYIDIYDTGIPVNPAAFYTYGHLATEGLYEMLPTDYSFLDAKEKGFSETNPLTETADKLFNYVTQFPAEKAYLHLAKPYLAYNEVMWYQAYVVAGPEHIPTTLSQNLKVELLDQDFNKLSEQELFIQDGTATGDFLISDTLESQTFYLRAYTDWMLNFNEEFIELRKFEIVDSEVNTSVSKPAAELKFYPEGGDLVYGLGSTLAFEYNLGKEPFKGEIRNSQGEVVNEFAGTNYIGRTRFYPQKGETYYAILEGSTQRFELPPIKENGIVLSVRNDLQYGQLYMALNTNESIKNKTGHLLIHTRGLIQYYEKIEWNDKAMSLNVPTEVLEDGLSLITYFDQDMMPLAERLIFKNDREELKVSIRLNEQEYDKRERTDVNLTVEDLQGNGQLASASISIIDFNQIDPNALEENIVSNLLLSSDIVGGLEDGLQYVNGATENLEKLDLILLTKGWRRFNWQDIKSNDFEIIHPPKVGFSVSGQVFAKKGRKPLKEQSLLFLSQFNNENTFQQSMTGETGSFEFEELKYFEGSSYLQMNGIKAGTRLNYDPMATVSAGQPVYTSKYIEPRALDPEKTKQLSQTQELQAVLDSTYYRDLGTVVVESTRFDDAIANQQRGFIYNAGNYSYSVTDLMKRGSYFRSPLHVLLGRVPGFTMISKIGDPLNPIVKLNRRDEGIVANANPQILFMVDDGQMALEDVMMMNPVRIDRIEVIKASQAFHLYGTAANGGVVAIYTKTPEELEDFNRFMSEKSNSNKDFDQFILPGGYYANREFYSPDYSTQEPEHIKADYRNIIHWETKIRTDEEGQFSFSFYNADIPTTALIMLEGVTDQGIAFTQTKSYKVIGSNN